MKKLVKKSVAIIEVAAMTLALAAGINLGTVKAADGTLTVNKVVSVSADEGESVTYTFTAPEDDIYYFTSIGEYDTYGDIYVGNESYGNDDGGEGLNFLLAQQLTKGQECSIKVKELDGDSFECDLIVYDSKTASTIPGNIEDMGNNEDYYCNLGESLTLGVIPRSLSGEELDIAEAGYTFEWYKYSSIEGETTDLEETGNTYTIAEVTTEDLYDQGDEYTYYYVSIYKDGEEIDQIYAYIYEKSSYIEVVGEDYDVAIGDKIVLEPTAYDYEGNEIDLSSDEYTFEWYKALEGDSELVGEELTYTIDSVTQEHLFREDSFSQYYTVIIYRNGKMIASANFYLYEKEEETTEAPTTEAPTTEAPTTTAAPTTTVAPTTTASEKVTAPAKAKIKKVNTKKKAAKKVKVSLKKTKGAKGYQIAVYTTKKNAKKNKKAIVKKFVTKTKVTITSKKLKNKKNLFIKARAYTLDGKAKVYGKWSAVKKVKIKK